MSRLETWIWFIIKNFIFLSTNFFDRVYFLIFNPQLHKWESCYIPFQFIFIVIFLKKAFMPVNASMTNFSQHNSFQYILNLLSTYEPFI